MFNNKLKKRIDALELLVNNINTRELDDYKDIKTTCSEVKYFKIGEPVPDDAILGLFGKYVKAIQEYLDIEITWNWENDPSRDIPKAKQIRVFRAKKKNN